MPRRRELREKIRDRMDGVDPDAAKKEKPSNEKYSGTPEEVVAALTPKQREALYDVLVEYSYRDFKSEEEEESEEV